MGRSGNYLSPFVETLEPTRASSGSPERNVPLPLIVQPPKIPFRAFWK